MFIAAAVLLAISMHHHNATSVYVVPVTPYLCHPHDYCA